MRNRALIIGVSSYPSGISDLPAVTFDVGEIANLLGSPNGAFSGDKIRVLADVDASRVSVTASLRDVLCNAQRDDNLFVYIAGHGCLDGKDYYFISHDARLADIAGTAVGLEDIKSMFDQSQSERILLWLDFCHSGGILERDFRPQENATDVIERTLHVTQGHGKVIMCACTASQSAYESGDRGHFTRYLVDGLRGGAVNAAGEITANSLHDYIDREMIKGVVG